MMQMANPFRFGRIVTGDEFVDREDEIAKMMSAIKSGTSVVLYSHRRMGKSSLLAEVMRRHKGEFVFAHVDLYGVTNKTRMVEAFMSALAGSAFGSVDKIVAGITEILKGSRFRVVLNASGQPGVEFAMAEPTVPEIQDVLDLPERIAKKRGIRIVVMFDEFQEIGLLDGKALLKSMRAKMQAHKHVSYVFAGSKRHLLLQIFEESEGAFYKSARPMELGPIPTEDFKRYIVRRFRSAGGALTPELAEQIVKLAEGNSYYVQQLAYELFEISPRPGPADLEKAIDATLAHQAPAFSFLWDSVKSRMQRRYLVAVAKEPGVPYGADFISRHQLKTPAHVQKCVKQLDARGLTDGGRIVDPVLALWLRRLGE